TPMPDDRMWGWFWSLLVTAFGAFLRFDRLAVPRALVFDETYYVKDAWSLLRHGVEWCRVNKPGVNDYSGQLVNAHHTNIFAVCPGGDTVSMWCSPRWASC